MVVNDNQTGVGVVKSSLDHQLTHIATVICTMALDGETNNNLVERILNNTEELQRLKILVSSEYSIDMLRNILSKEIFFSVLNNIR